MLIDLPTTNFFNLHDGEVIAYKHEQGTSQDGVLFLPGFRSSMDSTKSKAIYNFCKENSLEFTTFDYYGHGESSGDDGTKGTIGRWFADSLAILDSVTKSPTQILIGSSMGAWLMILLALERKQRIKGLIGIASAPDFSILLEEQIARDENLTKQMTELDFCTLPSKYDANGYKIHKTWLEEAKKHYILSKSMIDIECPVRLFHGTRDEDIPLDYANMLLDQLNTNDKVLYSIEDGDHRLSKHHEIEIILDGINEII
ncbi:alpha/beta hydrolase [Chaetoceros tenuissimus]|uniref:Alpha/beta hydrolase n=1 Tax=Chaetoceros tenuissimus TaxID=426638 RepID=A0AAD3CLM0_9STRA|nr:alpha/beta hydrolase [Chaetoceros tenuissimus]